MRSHRMNGTMNRGMVCGVACTFALMLGAEVARAGQRQYLVILATSPKQNGANPTLPNPQTIENEYFNGPNSFAEYWREISYGDVTISGTVTDWLQLPWRVQPDPIRLTGTRLTFPDLNDSGNYEYGRAEPFDPEKAMVVVDIDGDFGQARTDNGPFRPEDNPEYALGGKQMDAFGNPVFSPGERWIDFDGDGRWDGLDEARNEMDWDGDGRPDLRGPWIDLNGNGTPDNPAGCLYLDDWDNDGNPNWCPNGPGVAGCEGLGGPPGRRENPCPATTWTDAGNNTIVDCNGNLLDDTADIESGRSLDRLPFATEGEDCVPTDGDGIPDECQFVNWDVQQGCRPDTVDCGGEEPEACCNVDTCIPLPGGNIEPVARCEYDDVNQNRRLDIVEPFENFFAKGKIAANVRQDDPDFCENQLSTNYVLHNFPGEQGQEIAARSGTRQVNGSHDPFGKIPTRCKCSDLSDCRTIPADGETPEIARACPAGEHVQYDPPDFWINSGAAQKMTIDRRLLRIFSTPEPEWYEQAWRDRYGSTPPPWESQTLAVAPAPVAGVAARREFIANRGGLNGDGTGWLGCAAAVDARVIFATGLCAPSGGFEISCNRRIMPEETAGIGGNLLTYDGWIEYDDLPSSKYHQAGDQGLGEVTSPFSTNVWGQDRGTNSPAGGGPDFVIPAAGPYATQLHGQFGRDAGNVLQMELLTWRTNNCCPSDMPDCPAKCDTNGVAWEARHGHHQFAGPSGMNLGFRDYNLDGFIDSGESVPQGAENYLVDTTNNGPRGTVTQYPWNRKRVLEDCIEVLDDVLDFDDYVDPVAMDRITCGNGPLTAGAPIPFQESNTRFALSGIVSGIVLLPGGTLNPSDYRGATNFNDFELFPIHTEDGLGDPALSEAIFPKGPYSNGGPGNPPEKHPQFAHHLLFHDLVFDLTGAGGTGPIPGGDGQAAYSAHEYLHTWESFPDLYDYDIYDNPPGRENCHIGFWDIMANGGLVHPTPILKASTCTEWISPVDLTTVLTPGVEKTLTLPPSELVRDDSYYFLSNEDRPGEQFWIWSAGSGFDRFMPGAGVLVMHTDVGASNPDALPPLQRSGDRPNYAIVQADGRSDLRDCTNRGDAGDPFTGDQGQNEFNCGTIPASEWYTDGACTGLEMRNISIDSSGAATVALTWTPTTIPSLRFIDPPGGVTVGNPPNSIYDVRSEVSDVFGGTRIRFFYTTSESTLPDPTATTSRPIPRARGQCSLTGNPRTCVGGRTGLTCTTDADCDDTIFSKVTPGNVDLSARWNVSTLTDGRYYLFADLIPATGADGTEDELTRPRSGRNNQGNATLASANVDVSTSTLNANGQVATQGRARSETWTMRCINATTGEWVVNSSLTLPVPAVDAADQDPYRHAITGQLYVPGRRTAVGGAYQDIPGVTFTIQPGPANSPNRLGAVGDTFTFTTTGITARSEGVTIRNGRISEDPVATIDATPLSGLPPLTVSFDARRSTDPNGAPLTYRWTFGDNTPTATGAQVSHTYNDAGTFTATLRATNAAGRFGETSVDIRVINNTPNAVIRATPASGLAPLVVAFNAGQSSDTETPPEQLIYQWEFGDGTSANDARVRGLSFREVTHTYARHASGRQCTVAEPCTFTAKLTVTDTGGVSNSATVEVRVGNTNPTPNITFTSLTGASPHTVTFNAKNSTDAEFDPIEVEWIWGDGTPNEIYRAATGKTPPTDGSVPHTFTLPAGVASRSFTVRAILRDLTAAGTRKGGETSWPGVTVTVTVQGTDENRNPTARFSVTPEVGAAGEEMSFDASTSTDADGDDLRYSWDFGDGETAALSTNPVVTHTYDEAGNYTVRLTVVDEHDASATATRVVRVLGQGVNRAPTAIVATGPRTGPAPLSQTFDGRLSFDPDGDSLIYVWSVRSNDLLIDTLAGPVATRMFTNQGSFTVTLTVRDVRGLEDVADPVTVVVAGEVIPPDDGGEPPRPEPEEPPDSANQRPTPIACGVGMLGAFFGLFAGLCLTAVMRRRAVRS